MKTKVLPKIVFLDRDTLDKNIVLPKLGFTCEWQDYAQTRPNQTALRLQGADVALTNKVVIDASVIEACPGLKYVGIVATGTNVVDLDACRAKGIVVTNIKGYSTDAVAEHVFMFILALRKQLKAYQQSVSCGAWQQAQQFVYYHDSIFSLKGSTLGLVGTGAIAQACAHIAEAFGVQVLFYSPSGRPVVGGKKCVSLDELLNRSDIVSLHCPLNEKTKKLIGAPELEKMQAHAILVNTARGAVVDIPALVDALKRQQIAGAGLDVLPSEPPDADDPIMALVDFPNLVLTPHTAWASMQSQRKLADMLIQNIHRFYTGESLDNLAR